MKLPIATAILLVFFGATASAYARQEKGQEEHGQEQKAKPAEQKDKPAQQQPQHQQQHQAQPAAHQQTQNAKPAEQKGTEQAAHTQQPQTHAANNTERSNTERPAQAQQAHAQQVHAVAENKGGSRYGRISESHYASSFGSGHSFHVNRGEYTSRRFEYGGYSFGFVDPWPVAWGYSDDVYVVYADGGYYMYDRVHPGLRISINIL
jgi:hypothetical protein